MPHPTFATPKRPAFTLVEILTVIVIIGILAAIAIPAISNAVTTARQTAQRLEINSIANAVEQYLQTYGDYPPDGSNADVLNRHMRKLFPRMIEPDIEILKRLTDDSAAGVPTGAVFSGVAMDRGEALVFFLGGFSKDLQRPITGPGGQLAYIGPASPTAAELQDLGNYQINATRDNSLFPFDPKRLMYARATETGPLTSTDETLLGVVDGPHGGTDLLPSYRAVEREVAPLVYFDSRTYGVIETVSGVNTYNGFRTASVGGVRPYKTETVIAPPVGATYATEQEAFDAIQFHNPDTFQIISPGSDGYFGSIVSTVAGTPGATPTIHFVTESGRPVQPLASATTPSGLIFTDTNLGSRGYQDGDWLSTGGIQGHLDNITNFSKSTLEGDLK